MANREVQRTCPLCGQNRHQTWKRKGALHLARCLACSMVFANPIEEELASGQFYDRLGVPFYLSPDKLESDYSPVRFERELRLFRAFCSQGKVLDVGCSTGAFLHQLSTRYPGQYQVTGTDVTSAALNYAESQGIPVRRDSFLEWDTQAQKWEAITFWAVLEHIVQPGLFLRQAAALLKPGGHGFILVPNLNSLAVRLLGVKYRYIMPDHLNYFTPRTLCRFVEQEPSIRLIKTGSMHFNPLVILRDWRGGIERVADSERAGLLKRTTAYKQNPWLRPVKWLYSRVEQILGWGNLADNIHVVFKKL